MQNLIKISFLFYILLSFFYIDLSFINTYLNNQLFNIELPNHILGLFDLYFLFLSTLIIILLLFKKFKLDLIYFKEISLYLIFVSLSVLYISIGKIFFNYKFELFSYLILLKQLHWIFIFLISAIIIKNINFKFSEIILIMNIILFSLLIYLCFILFLFSINIPITEGYMSAIVNLGILITHDTRIDLPFSYSDSSNIFYYLVIYFILINLSILERHRNQETKKDINLALNYMLVFFIILLSFAALSRSGILGFLITLVFYFFFDFIFKNKKLLNININYLLIFVLIVMQFTFIYIYNNYNYDNILGLIDFEFSNVIDRFFNNIYPIIERLDILLDNLTEFNQFEISSNFSVLNYFHFLFGFGPGSLRILDNLYLILLINYGIIGSLLYILFFFFIMPSNNIYLKIAFIFLMITSLFSDHLLHSQRFLNFFFCSLPLILYLKKDENSNN